MQKQISKYLTVLRTLRTIDAEFPLSYFMILLEVALQEGCSLVDLKNETGMPMPTLSRIVGALSDKRQKNAMSYDLLRQELHKSDPRRKALYLTAKGKHLVQKISGIIAQ